MKTDTTQAVNKTRGAYRTPDGKAQIDWHLNPTLKGLEFSAQGSTADGCGGQCLEEIAKAYPTDSTVQSMARIWREWHLNGMRAGTPEQRRLGWKHGFDVCMARADMTEPQLAYLRKRNYRELYKTSAVSDCRDAMVKENVLKEFLTYWQKMFPGKVCRNIDRQALRQIARGEEYKPKNSYSSEYVSPHHWNRLCDALGKLLKDLATEEEAKAENMTVKSEIFPDSIGAPCPLTGYPYGSAWLFEPLPADIMAEIKSWPEGDGLSLHEWRTQNFFAAHGIDCRITLSNSKPASWSPAGNHYRVTLSRKDESGRLCFDFWGSANDASKGKAPTQGAILGCIASDIYTPNTLEEFCNEYGANPDSLKDRQTFVRARNHARKLREFFTEEERQEVETLRD